MVMVALALGIVALLAGVVMVVMLVLVVLVMVMVVMMPMLVVMIILIVVMVCLLYTSALDPSGFASLLFSRFAKHCLICLSNQYRRFRAGNRCV